MAFILIISLLLVLVTAWGVYTHLKLNRLARRFKSVIEIDKYVQDSEKEAKSLIRVAEQKSQSIRDAAKQESDSLISIARKESQSIRAAVQQEAASIRETATEEANSLVRKAEKEVEAINEYLSQISGRLESVTLKTAEGEKELERLQEEIRIAQDAAYLQEVGYYENHYEFEDIPSYERELLRIREQQKKMLKEDGTGNNQANAAAYITQKFYYNNSLAEGRTAQKQHMKLMLRAFNGECDSFISRVNYRNIDTMGKRIESSFNVINVIAGKYFCCALNPSYLSNRIDELRLVYEYEEAKQREKEEQARIREQIREEEKAARELEKAKKQAEQDEIKYTEMLRKAQEEAQAASEEDKNTLNKKIAELQLRLQEAEQNKRNISQAELTRSGHVYIISNIGSFGDNVFKIGMTRRLDPMDRVKELSNASVPFPFDVHAMIRTSDAPTLENLLHRHFDDRRINLENNRKEFFRVSIDEIRQELAKIQDELGIQSELRLTLIAEAKEYRMSEAKRKHIEGT